MILRMTPHGEEAHVKIDRIPYAGFKEHLILLRIDGQPAIHALTETEYRSAMLRLIYLTRVRPARF